ncbi:MAG: hypothetical protein LBL71_03035 [Endomicrobium sp.]|jgi:spore photoproduct lyase|nr:hypothetical protein [Endomicrobium sp.]
MNTIDILTKKFPHFGINKLREITRLVQEISSIEKIQISNVINTLMTKDYESIKNELLKRRYPKSFGKVPMSSYYLPKYETDILAKAVTTSSSFYPKNIYYEPEIKKYALFENIKNSFPASKYIEIESIKAFLKVNHFTLKDYNNRIDNLFLVTEKYSFFKRCPCTSGVINCNYYIMNTGTGCLYNCSYCFLQGYQNIPGIVINCNITDYLQDEKITPAAHSFFNYKRIGNGEFTDSLIFDYITNFSTSIINYFKTKKEIFFEFKTKSLNIENLLKAGGQKNIVAAWSVNAEEMATANEFGTPSIQERLKAAQKCARAGFSTAFHLDPIIYYKDWQNGYKQCIDMIFDTVHSPSIKWISLGTLRMPAYQKVIIENRFPETKILNGELLLGHDHKLRYHENLRIEMYKFINQKIQSKKAGVIVYLCMETADIWKRVFNIEK